MGVLVQVTDDIRWNLDLRGEKKVQKGLNDTGDAFDELGDQAETAGKKSDKAGDKFKETADDAGHLQKEIDRLTASYKSLLTQFDETGDSSLLKDIGKERRNLRKFQNLSKELGDPIADIGTDVGRSFLGQFADSFKGGGAALRGAATPVLVGLGVAAAPGIGAAVSAAVLGAVGTGGIVGGIALAANDPRVKDAAGQVGESLAADFRDSASQFIDPLLRSLEKVGNAGWADKLTGPLGRLSAKVDPLADGLIGLVDNALPGFTQALDASGPTLDVLADHLPKIGQAIGDVFSEIADNPRAAAIFLDQFLTQVEGAIEFGGDFIGVLSDIYTGAYDLGVVLGLIEPEMKVFKRGTDDGSDALKGFETSAEAAERAITELDASIKKTLDQAFGLEEAEDAAADAFARLKEQVKQQREENDKHAGSLIGNTQAARDNREAIRGIAEDYGTLIVEYTEAGKSTEGLRKKFLDNAVAAGIARVEAEKYAKALFGIPTRINVALILKAQGDIAAWSALRKQDREDEASGFPKRASGGPVSGGKTYWVGENGPELVTMGADGYVHNAAASRAMTSGASGGSSMPMGVGAAAGMTVTVVATDALARALAESLRFDIRTTANGDPTEYWT